MHEEEEGEGRGSRQRGEGGTKGVGVVRTVWHASGTSLNPLRDFDHKKCLEQKKKKERKERPTKGKKNGVAFFLDVKTNI